MKILYQIAVFDGSDGVLLDKIIFSSQTSAMEFLNSQLNLLKDCPFETDFFFEVSLKEVEVL